MTAVGRSTDGRSTDGRSTDGPGALLLDYGGVLTAPVAGSFARFEEELGMPSGRSFALLIRASRTSGGGPIGALERGELSTEDFDAELRRLLTEDGYEVPTDRSLLEGLLAAMEPFGRLWELPVVARRAGLKTGLLSNSWGLSAYPFDLLRASFDDLVISGEVGLRKPDPAIYRLAAERLGIAPEECVFIDDLERNVEVARDLGMIGIVHRGDDEATIAAFDRAVGLDG